MTDSARKILIFPGWGFSADILKDWIPACAGTTIETHTQDIADNISDSAVIVAWSFGGLTAIDFCQKYPEKCSKLILISTTPQFVCQGEWQGVKQTKIQAFIQAIKSNREEALNQFIQWVQFPSHNKVILEKLKQALRNDEHLYSELCFFADLDLREAYLNLKVPTLHVLGEQDPLLNCQSIQGLADLNACISIKVIKQAGHAPFLTHQQECQNLIQEFLS